MGFVVVCDARSLSLSRVTAFVFPLTFSANHSVSASSTPTPDSPETTAEVTQPTSPALRRTPRRNRTGALVAGAALARRQREAAQLEVRACKLRLVARVNSALRHAVLCKLF